MRYVNTHMKRMMYMPPYSVHAEPCSAWSDDLEMLSGRYLLHIFTKNSLSALGLILRIFTKIKKGKKVKSCECQGLVQPHTDIT